MIFSNADVFRHRMGHYMWLWLVSVVFIMMPLNAGVAYSLTWIYPPYSDYQWVRFFVLIGIAGSTFVDFTCYDSLFRFNFLHELAEFKPKSKYVDADYSFMKELCWCTPLDDKLEHEPTFKMVKSGYTEQVTFVKRRSLLFRVLRIGLGLTYLIAGAIAFGYWGVLPPYTWVIVYSSVTLFTSLGFWIEAFIHVKTTRSYLYKRL